MASDTKAAGLSVEEHVHTWEHGNWGDSWGVIVGVSRCKTCGKRSSTSDFPHTEARKLEREKEGARG